MYITYQKLKAAGACPTQRHQFFFRFPFGAEVTVENCLKALRTDLSLGWLVEAFVDSFPLLVTYSRARSRAWRVWRIAFLVAEEECRRNVTLLSKRYYDEVMLAGGMFSPAAEQAYRLTLREFFERFVQCKIAAWDDYLYACAEASYEAVTQQEALNLGVPK